MKIKEDKNDWYTVSEFVATFPKEFRSTNAAYRLASHRSYNGLESMGACTKRPGRPLMFHRANYERWLESGRD